MRLKPVTECRPQHTCGRPRRTALHDEVLAIKKICGIPAIERKRLESRKRSEHRGCPLPSVAQHSFNSESALSLRISVHRRGIPALEIEVAESSLRSFPSPGIQALALIRSTVRRALPLLFRRQCLARPAGVSGSLGTAHIDGPIHRQREFFEHPAIKPAAAGLFPKHRMVNAIGFDPLPIVLAPENLFVVSAGIHELKELRIRDHVAIDFKSRNIGPI